MTIFGKRNTEGIDPGGVILKAGKEFEKIERILCHEMARSKY